MLFAVVTLTGVVVHMTHASGPPGGEAAAIKIPPRIPRLEVDLRSSRRRQPQRSSRPSRQRCSHQGQSGGELPFPDGTIIAGLAWSYVPSEENNKVFRRSQSFVPGPPRTFSSWLRTPENTPRRVVGGSHNSKTATLPTRLRSKLASPATSLSKLRDFVFTHYAP